jgi:NitT/TauT family transport system substrate-binding protein
VIADAAKQSLAASDTSWEAIARRLEMTHPAELALYRKTYRDGLPRRPIAEEAADARALYAILAEIGGPTLVGPAPELDPGTFYEGPAKPADR